MSGREEKIPVVKCDHPGCYCRRTGIDGQTIDHLRADVERLGWRSFGEKDWCPTHVPKLPKP
jgi:hypothetical protein